MKKDYSVEIIGSPKTLADFDFNELKLNALICELEQEILNIRLKRLVLKNSAQEPQPVVPVSSPPNNATGSFWQRVKTFFGKK